MITSYPVIPLINTRITVIYYMKVINTSSIVGLLAECQKDFSVLIFSLYNMQLDIFLCCQLHSTFTNFQITTMEDLSKILIDF